MLSPRLFWKLFLIYAALQLATVTAFVVLVSNWQEREAFLQKRYRLRDAAAILHQSVHAEFQSTDAAERQRLVDELGRQTNLRVTLVAIDGTVLADSEQTAQSMENHQDRTELADAAKFGTGNSQRFSPTLKVPMLYHAMRVDDNGQPIGLVRVAVPLSEVQDEVSLIERTLWLVALGVSLGGLFLTYLVVGRALMPVRTLTQAANAMAEGEYQQRVQVPSRDELGALAQSFNRMGGEIEAREGQLREVVDRMSAVLGGMVEGVFAVDDEQRLLFANKAAGQLLNFQPEGVQGKPLSKAVKKKMLRQLVIETLNNASGNVVRQIEIKNAQSEVVLAVNGARLPGEPCPGVVVVMHDVSELRRLETLRQEFVANVSHELKTPLSAIMAYAETLRRGAFADPQHSVRFLRQIEDQASRLAELIQDMLHLARIEAGHAPYEIIALQMGEVVDKCLAAHESTAESKTISLNAQSELRRMAVRADEEALRQILDNLVTNAIKYTPDGGRIDVGWAVEDSEVAIWVKDTGIGIPSKHQGRVFERFYRVDKARSRELGGTGLGLSIVKHLAQTLGGSVSLNSAPGQGSTFEVRLPAAQSPEVIVEATL